MGRGGSGETGTTATRRGASEPEEAPALDFLPRSEHWKTMPDSIQWVGSSVIVPCRQMDVDGKQIAEATRCCLGSDGVLYVLRQRDTYEKRLLGKNRLIKQETATRYKGKSLSAVADAMNADLEDLGGDTMTFSGVFKVAGGTVSPHSRSYPYRVGRLVESLEGLLDTPQNERTKRVLDSFGLDI